jgi:hypothetical protein
MSLENTRILRNISKTLSQAGATSKLRITTTISTSRKEATQRIRILLDPVGTRLVSPLTNVDGVLESGCAM